MLRRPLPDLHRILLAHDLKIAQRVRRIQLQSDRQVSGGLCPISIRPQRNRQQGFEALHWNIFLVFHFKALGSEGMNRHDPCAEHRAAAGFVQAALALLQQPRIDGLHFGLLVDLFGAAPLQNHTRNPRDIVPHGKIGHDRATGQGENISAFQRDALMISENLPRRHARVSVIDVDIDGHLFERKPRRIGLLLVAWQQHSGIAKYQSRRQNHYWDQRSHCPASSFSTIRTSPLSAPI